jgi:enoyl-CoA hydratase
MTIRVETQDRVTTIIIDRPEVRNAIDGDTARGLTAAFQQFEADDNADVAVLYGDHGCFCSGADLAALASTGNNINFSEYGDGPLGPSRMRFSKPVIAAVAGHAVAGGLELALMCDLRVAEESAVFGVFCRRFGVPLVDGGTIRLPRLIGHSRAMDMILTGRPVAAAEALAMGLANRVVADGTSRAAAEKIAHDISRFPQNCLRHDRLSACEQWDMDIESATVNEYHHGKMVIDSRETELGAMRFTQGGGRHGQFPGDEPG